MNNPGYQGTAIAGTADDPLQRLFDATRKRGFEGKFQLTSEMFVGKSTTDPIDLGEMVVEPAGPR